MTGLVDLLGVVAADVGRTVAHNWPYLTLAVVVASVVQVYVGTEHLARWLRRRTVVAILAAVAVASLTPFCSCGTTAVVLGALASAVPWAPVVAFMVSSPLTSPEEYVLSTGLFGTGFAIVGAFPLHSVKVADSSAATAVVPVFHGTAPQDPPTVPRQPPPAFGKQAPRKIQDVRPAFPAGSPELPVIVSLRLDASGSVVDAAPVEGPADLSAIALGAVRQWRFSPTGQENTMLVGFNPAAAASDIPERELTAPFDSVSVCFSKGLGAPVGSALVGSKALIERARRFRKMYGGGMRQSGIIAAGALYALRHHRARLADDHANAKALAIGLGRIAGLEVNVAEVETNMVRFGVRAMPAKLLEEKLRARGVLVLAVGKDVIRAVTNLMVSAEDIQTAIAMTREAMESQKCSIES